MNIFYINIYNYFEKYRSKYDIKNNNIINMNKKYV